MIRAEDIATQRVRTITPMTTVRQASEIMEAHNIGFLPVVKNGQALGVVTDRDIAIRAFQRGAPMGQLVESIMSKDLVCVPETASVDEVAKKMAEKAIRRVLVTNNEGGLVGVISLDDLAVFTHGDSTVGQILRKIAVGTPIRLSKHDGARPIMGMYQPVEEIC